MQAQEKSKITLIWACTLPTRTLALLTRCHACSEQLCAVGQANNTSITRHLDNVSLHGSFVLSIVVLARPNHPRVDYRLSPCRPRPCGRNPLHLFGALFWTAARHDHGENNKKTTNTMSALSYDAAAADSKRRLSIRELFASQARHGPSMAPDVVFLNPKRYHRQSAVRERIRHLVSNLTVARDARAAGIYRVVISSTWHWGACPGARRLDRAWHVQVCMCQRDGAHYGRDDVKHVKIAPKKLADYRAVA